MRDKHRETDFTTAEAAELLGVSQRTVQLWAEDGRLSCWKTEGGHRRIRRDSVSDLLVKAGLAPVRPAIPLDEPEGTARVLVVDDDAGLQRLYRMKLGLMFPRGLVIDTASNGFEGLVSIGRCKPHLLISDLHMPGLDGYSMLRALRKMPMLDDMEIMVVTGLEPRDVEQAGGLPTGISVLTKPIPFDAIAAVICRLVPKIVCEPSKGLASAAA